METRSKLLKTADAKPFDINKVRIVNGTREQGGEWTFRAMYGSKRIGYLMLWTHKLEGMEPDERAVYKASVAPEFQRKGVATKLYDAAEAFLKTQGLRLAPGMGAELQSVSDDAYKFWRNRAPEHPRVLNDARLHAEQYVGKPIRYRDENWTIKGAYNGGFTLTNSDETKITSVKPEVVYEAYGEPGQSLTAAEHVASKEGSKKQWLGLALAPLLMTQPTNSIKQDQKPATPTHSEPHSWAETMSKVPKDFKSDDVIDRRHGEKPSLGEKVRDLSIAVQNDWKDSFDKSTEEEMEQDLKRGPTPKTPQKKSSNEPCPKDRPKVAYISPRNGELTVAIEEGQRPQVTIGLDLGIPNFTQFIITFPTAGLEPDEVSSYSRQALSALLDDVSAFLITMKYPEDQIVEVTALAQDCFHKLRGKDSTDADMPDRDDSLRLYEGEFEIPDMFYDATYSKVVTAAAVKRTPEVRALELVPLATEDGSPEQVIQFFRDQSVRSTPRAFEVRLHESLTPKAKKHPADWKSRLIREKVA